GRDRPAGCADRVQVRVQGAADEVEAVSNSRAGIAEQHGHLVAVAALPGLGIQAQQRVHDQTHPRGTRGGIRPGCPSATGCGPRMRLPVLIVSTPAPSTATANRSMPRGAGPYASPAAL